MYGRYGCGVVFGNSLIGVERCIKINTLLVGKLSDGVARGSSNGRTTVSGTVNQGSNPCPRAASLVTLPVLFPLHFIVWNGPLLCILLRSFVEAKEDMLSSWFIGVICFLFASKN